MTAPPVAVVPLFMQCTHCGGVFRTTTTWARADSSTYRRCLWCRRLTKLPVHARPVDSQNHVSH